MDQSNANEPLKCKCCNYEGIPKVVENPYTVTGDPIPRMHITARCSLCDAYIKHLPQNKNKPKYKPKDEPVILKKTVKRYEG